MVCMGDILQSIREELVLVYSDIGWCWVCWFVLGSILQPSREKYDVIVVVRHLTIIGHLVIIRVRSFVTKVSAVFYHIWLCISCQ